MAELLEELFSYFKGRPPNDSQVKTWVRALKPYALGDIRRAVEKVMHTSRYMPTVEDVLAEIRTSMAPRLGGTMEEKLELTDQEREFNLAMFNQLMRYIRKELTLEQFILNARAIERRHGIPPNDWSKFGIHLDEQRELG